MKDVSDILAGRCAFVHLEKLSYEKIDSVSPIGEDRSSLISLIMREYSSVGKRIVKTPKGYFSDTELLSFLVNFTPKTLPDSPMLGEVWERFVFAEFRKRCAALRRPLDLWYCRYQRSREIDIVAVSGGDYLDPRS